MSNQIEMMTIFVVQTYTDHGGGGNMAAPPPAPTLEETKAFMVLSQAQGYAQNAPDFCFRAVIETALMAPGKLKTEDEIRAEVIADLKVELNAHQEAAKAAQGVRE